MSLSATKPTFSIIVALLLAPLASFAQEAPAGPLYHEAVREFTGMKTTLYQHKTEVDREAGSYKYDCVRFVSYAMRQVAPQAWETILREMRIARGRIPSPPSYQKFFARLLEKPQSGWEAVPRAADLRPGDIVSWDYKTERASGHAVIIAGVPKQTADGGATRPTLASRNWHGSAGASPMVWSQRRDSSRRSWRERAHLRRARRSRVQTPLMKLSPSLQNPIA